MEAKGPITSSSSPSPSQTPLPDCRDVEVKEEECGEGCGCGWDCGCGWEGMSSSTHGTPQLEDGSQPACLDLAAGEEGVVGSFESPVFKIQEMAPSGQGGLFSPQSISCCCCNTRSPASSSADLTQRRSAARMSSRDTTAAAGLWDDWSPAPPLASLTSSLWRALRLGQTNETGITEVPAATVFPGVEG